MFIFLVHTTNLKACRYQNNSTIESLGMILTSSKMWNTKPIQGLSLISGDLLLFDIFLACSRELETSYYESASTVVQTSAP